MKLNVTQAEALEIMVMERECFLLPGRFDAPRWHAFLRDRFDVPESGEGYDLVIHRDVAEIPAGLRVTP